MKAATLHPSTTRSKSALRSATVANVKGGFAAAVSWRMKQCVCPAGRPSRGPARQPGHFSCFAKRSNQEKATPEMAPRYAGSPRRWHRNREASETRCAQTADASLSDFGTSDVAPSTGIHCNGNGNCNGNCNGNGRCAECQGQLQRTHGTLVWQEAVDRQHVDRAGSTQPTRAAAFVGWR